MKRILLLSVILIVVNFIAIHYLLKGQSTIINVLVISAIGGIFGLVCSKYGIRPKVNSRQKL